MLLLVPPAGRRAACQSRLAVGALLTAGLLGTGVPPATAEAAPEWETLTATSADAFVDTVGVNTHINYTDTVYADQARTRRLLVDLGVRHIRDGVKADNPGMHAALRRLRDDGIHASLIVDPSGRFGSGPLADQVAALTDPDRLAGVAATLEGPNELDCGDWNDDVRRQQKELSRAVAEVPALRDVPLLGPSWCRGVGSVSTYGADGSDSDAWNLHPYPGGYMPETGEGGNSWSGGTIAGQYTQARGVETQPVYATETGYHNAVKGDGDGHNPTSERAAGPYAARLALEYARLGVQRSFFYELQDERSEPTLVDREQSFGLVRHDGTLKPAYRSLQTLLGTLADPGDQVANRQVEVGVTGAPADLRRMAFARRDGSVDLVLWRARSLWDPNAKRDLEVPAVTVGLATRADTTATAVRVLGGAERTSLGSGRTFEVSVDGSPVIVRLGAGGSAPQPSTPPTPGPTTSSTPEPATPTSGTYRLVNEASGHCLDVARASTQVGADVQQWTCNTTAAQDWTLQDAGDGTVALTAGPNGQCLDVKWNSAAPGADVWQYPCNGTTAQRWKLRRVKGSTYTLLHHGTDQALDNAGGSLKSGGNVQQWTDHGRPPQQWRLKPR